MTSYTHTCTECGVEMTVHERYSGRTLRCRECRAEFVADPGSAGGESAAGPLPPPVAHTCTACGAVMNVPARYSGRTLRCTSCGEQFTARLPVVVDGAERSPADGSTERPPERRGAVVEVPRDPDARARRLRWGLAAGGVLAICAALLWWLGGDRGEGFGSSLFAAEKQRTQIGRLQLGDEPTVPVALDRDALDQLVAAAKAGDPASLQAIRQSSRCLSLPSGTRVRVLERRGRGAEARVRILDGPHSSRIVWVPIRWVK